VDVADSGRRHMECLVISNVESSDSATGEREFG
jgi:hypothetical protein